MTKYGEREGHDFRLYGGDTEVNEWHLEMTRPFRFVFIATSTSLPPSQRAGRSRANLGRTRAAARVRYYHLWDSSYSVFLGEGERRNDNLSLHLWNKWHKWLMLQGSTTHDFRTVYRLSRPVTCLASQAMFASLRDEQCLRESGLSSVRSAD